MKTVTIYTDGACSGNPGPGGWGAILRYGEHEKELSGGEAMTTNNRMELTAVIRALEALKEPCAVELWERLLELTDMHEMRYHWVKGHADNEYNERCDALAVAAREREARTC